MPCNSSGSCGLTGASSWHCWAGGSDFAGVFGWHGSYVQWPKARQSEDPITCEEFIGH